MVEKLCSEKVLSQSSIQKLFDSLHYCLVWMDNNKDLIDLETNLQISDFLFYYEKEKDFAYLFQDYRISFLININKAYFLEQERALHASK